MDRRSFLKTTGAVAAVAGTGALATPAIAQGRKEWKMVTTWPKNFPGLGVGAQRLADRITTATDGRVTVKLFAAGELVPAFESFDAVSNGTAEMYHAPDYYWQGKHPSFAFFTAVPLGFTAPEINAWIQFLGGQALWDELSGGFGVKPFLCGNTGVQMGGWFRKEINSLEDLKGLKFRMPGIGGEALRQLGVNVIALPGGEIFQALQSGAIDGTEWVGPLNDLAFGFYRIAKNYYYPGFHEPGSAICAGINASAFGELSKTDQFIVEQCCLADNEMMYAEFTAKNGQALDTLVSQHGVQLKKFPEDVFDGFAKASEEVVMKIGDYDDLAKRVRDSYLKTRADLSKWTQVAEQDYSNERTRSLGKL
ncbi:TRAP transporter substrate-binding protein [Acuticoccus mangrovi]|uniref:TRAP transporter substrate-binding protein n=1 Tax=Acuticoccus mangrovi TaxID=2796142 RepID=A0A934IJ98_9HYPH|nr:TRAP transporter substrate-binding protein [Acuticoccus mangrovi]MBJ3776026.1 TRAP transporter substrate-binding protein [Acuticoccus mangrovi]